MFFPVAAIDINPLEPLGVACAISLACSMTGISGAFLLLPYQISILGYAQPGVSATNQIFNILACPAGVYRYAREGRLLAPLAGFIALGTLPGVFAGAVIRISLLTDKTRFMFFAGLVLFYLGWRMCRQTASQKSSTNSSAAPPRDKISNGCRVLACSWRGFRFTFCEREYAVSSPGLLLLSCIVGLIGGIYGVGGGAIIVPFLVAFYGLPLYAIAGASLFATFITSLAGVVFYTLLAAFWDAPHAAPDWKLGLLLGFGGMCGMYCGAALQKYIPAKFLRYLLIIIILTMGTGYLAKSSFMIINR